MKRSQTTGMHLHGLIKICTQKFDAEISKHKSHFIRSYEKNDILIKSSSERILKNKR